MIIRIRIRGSEPRDIDLGPAWACPNSRAGYLVSSPLVSQAAPTPATRPDAPPKPCGLCGGVKQWTGTQWRCHACHIARQRERRARAREAAAA